jgi:hypothetical protein
MPLHPSDGSGDGMLDERDPPAEQASSNCPALHSEEQVSVPPERLPSAPLPTSQTIPGMEGRQPLADASLNVSAFRGYTQTPASIGAASASLMPPLPDIHAGGPSRS